MFQNIPLWGNKKAQKSPTITGFSSSGGIFLMVRETGLEAVSFLSEALRIGAF
jgi:hypothetical protein